VLEVREVDRLGPIVVDGEGFTLYRFDGDGDGGATCTDACASTWPPAVVDPSERMAVAGVEKTDVGLVRRRDGTVQLTVGGWPVYRFAGDARPGRDSGHGIGGVWFAVTPTGAKATPP
jgi:predicted lipoprotein with Yx(FWY)xxD motif